jgi:hypothetical protein
MTDYTDLLTKAERAIEAAKLAAKKPDDNEKIWDALHKLDTFQDAANPETIIEMIGRIRELGARSKWPKTKKRSINVDDIVGEMKASYEED